ncbi:MAG: hypothetical protein LIO87_08670, partial [Eubacterium sp.]|nr:hypothetical protein [Eubacterium sp.]
SHPAAGIYWNDCNLDIGKIYLSKKGKILRTKKVILLSEYLFELLKNFSEDLYIIPSFYIENGTVKRSQSNWFSGWQFSKSNVFYREILEEANRCKVNLKETHCLSFSEYGLLAQRLCRGNTEQISDVTFCCPNKNFALRPTYDVQLILYGSNKETIEALTKFFLNCSSELTCYDINADL